MKPEEFKELTSNFHLKVQQKLRERNLTAPIQIMPSMYANTQTIIVGNSVYSVFNDGNFAQWRFEGNYI